MCQVCADFSYYTKVDLFSKSQFFLNNVLEKDLSFRCSNTQKKINSLNALVSCQVLIC